MKKIKDCWGNIFKKIENEKDLRILILTILKESDGVCDFQNISYKINKNLFIKKDNPIDDKKLTHILYLLEKEEAVERIEKISMARVDYFLMPWGHALLRPLFPKWWYFCLHKNHNLFAFLAFIISIIGTILSIIAITKN